MGQLVHAGFTAEAASRLARQAFTEETPLLALGNDILLVLGEESAGPKWDYPSDVDITLYARPSALPA